MFAVSPATTLVDAYRRVWEAIYPPVPFKTAEALPSEATASPIDFAGTIPTSFRFVDGRIWARLLSVDGSLPAIPNAIHVDMLGNPDHEDPMPWRIHNYIFSPKV
jgi:hypothetical protein